MGVSPGGGRHARERETCAGDDDEPETAATTDGENP